MPRRKFRCSFMSCPGRKRGCSFTSCLGRRSDAVLCHAQDEGRMQFYVIPRTRKGVQFYVVLRTKVGCSFMSCPGRRSDAVLRHAQDENKFKTPSISCHEPGVLWFYLGTLHLVWLRGNYTKKHWRKVLNFKFLRRFVSFLLQIWPLN